MRTFLIFLLLIGALTLFVSSKARVRTHIGEVWVDECLVPEPPVLKVARNRVVTQKPTIKRTKRNVDQEAAYTFAVKGWAPTTEEARKDALEQATKVVTAALDLRYTRVTDTKLAQLITDTQDGSEVPLGDSDGKELGSGKQILVTFELPGDYIRELGQKERGYRMEERMSWIARGLAVIVAALFAITGYVRLDEWSKGYFSGVLKAVAVLAVIGAGSAVYFLR